ncbi:MAG TPA: ATP synthase F1 subunit delta [Anaeromyxobacteraceae bacterium]|nr:ATP synthase F1 subunit delta [Anaeromyxobacteraceae bacterium]
MIMGSIARRYAKALFSLAVEKGRVEAWSESLLALGKAVDQAPDLRDVLSNPAYTREQRRAVVAMLAESMKLDEEIASLLFLLGDRNRFGYLKAILESYAELADQQLGRVRAQVTSAVPLDDAQAAALAEKLAVATKAKVIVERAVDPALLGGVVAQVGSLVYDGSLRTQLEDLRKSLKQ